METLEKALQTATSTSTLYQTDLAPQIYQLLLKETPLLNLLGTEEAQGPVHQFRMRTALPAAWVQGELSDADFRSATYTLKSVPLKIVRSWGGVSSFAQTLTQRWLNQYQEALGSSVEGLANTLEYLWAYGNAADTYQFDGIGAAVAADATAGLDYTAGGNIYNVGAALTLTHLDNAIDRVKGYRGGTDDTHIILASRNMISRISGLQTRVSRIIDTIEYEGGFRMASYRGVGLLPSDIMVPAGTSTSPTPTGAAAAGGSLADGSRYYAVASVTLNGEQLASASTAVVTTATTNNTSHITWTADSNAKLYKIYRGSTNVVANMTLLTTIAAITYDGSGNITGSVTSYDDTGAIAATTAAKPMVTDGEQLMVVNISKNDRGNRVMGAVSVLGDKLDNFVSYVPLATTNGSFRFMLEMFTALKTPYPQSNMIIRNAKLA